MVEPAFVASLESQKDMSQDLVSPEVIANLVWPLVVPTCNILLYAPLNGLGIDAVPTPTKPSLVIRIRSAKLPPDAVDINKSAAFVDSPPF